MTDGMKFGLMLLGGAAAVGLVIVVVRAATPAQQAQQQEGFTPYQQQSPPQTADDNSLALGITNALGRLAGTGLDILRDDRNASREAAIRQENRTQTLQDRAYCAEHPGGPGCPPGPASASGPSGPRAAA